MRIAVFGGSFDPPHVAHVLAVRYVLSVGLVERVVVVPVFHHALDKKLSPFPLRVEMCKAAFLGDERVSVSELEATLPAPSYTLHTLEALRKMHPEDELRLVVGADVLGETRKWHEFERVERLAPLIVLGRAGIDTPDAPPAVLPDVSSTEARKWWHAGVTEVERAKRERLIPVGVREVIERTGLYRNLSS